MAMKFPEKLLPLVNTPHTHNKIKGGRGGGKSFTVSDLIVAVMSQLPLQILCCRETQKSLKESSYSLLKKSVIRSGNYHIFNFTDSGIESISGARSVFIGLKEHTVESIKSYEGFHWAWVEESHAVSHPSLEVLIPTLRTDGYFNIDLGDGIIRTFPLRMFLYTLNPFSWADPIDIVLPNTREDVQEITINYCDNPFFPESLEQERVQQKETFPAEEYNRIWEGIPYDEGERGVLGRKQVEAAMARKVPAEGEIVTAADIARFGKDSIVFMKRKGFQVIDTAEYKKLDTQTTARLLNDFAEGGSIILDDTGVGGGVTDKLMELSKTLEFKCTTIKPINFGSKAIDRVKYPDIISEMWFNLRDKIGVIGLPNNKRLKQELISRNFKYTPDEKRKVESKEEYKKRTGLSSPDWADCAIMLFYEEQFYGMRAYDAV
jgi:hypothetical protein